MTRRNTTATFDIPQMMLDVITVFIAFFISYSVAKIFNAGIDLEYHLWMMFVYAVIFVLAMALNRMYNLTTFYYIDRVFMRIFYSSGISISCITLIIFMTKLLSSSRLMSGLFFAFSMVLVLIQRILRYRARHTIPFRSEKQALFIGTNDSYEKYISYLDKTAMNYAFIKSEEYDSEFTTDLVGFEKFLMRKTLDEVVIAYNQDTDFDYVKYMKICEEMGITIRLIWDMKGLDISEKYVSSIGTFPVVTYHSVSFNQIELFAKKLMDFSASFIGIILLLPVYIVTAIAIRAESKGPAIFKQKRVGINGKVFEIYKFRSMCIDAEEQKARLMAQNKVKGGLMFKMDDDPRITKVGAFIRKTSIDELPQLFNVLKGDMSLVGTRPPTIDEVKKYNRNQHRRISIKPGITGMWQVSGRSNIVDFDKVVELDKIYIDSWSLFLDIKLLFKTVGVVLKHNGAC